MSFLSKLFGKSKKANTQTCPECDVQDVNYSNDYNWDDEYFAGIINSMNLPGYTVERNVHPSVFDINAHPKCYPVTFMIKQSGQPILAVMIMKINQANAMISRGTYSILEDQGIRYIRFFREMLNDSTYVIERVKQNLY